MASALKRNATLTTFGIWSASINAAAALLSNPTLQELTIFKSGHFQPSGVWLSSLFLALGTNTTLKSLVVAGFNFAGEMCPALQDGLGKNSTL
jgi:hypothetical protein